MKYDHAIATGDYGVALINATNIGLDNETNFEVIAIILTAS